MMESLFRFVLVRPPLPPDPTKPSIKLAQDSKLQTALVETAGDKDRRKALDKIVDEYVQDQDRFLASASATPFQRKLLAFGSVLDKASKLGPLTIVVVNEASKKELGDSSKIVVETEEFKDLLARLKDTVVALKFAQEGPIEALSAQIRDCELLKFAATVGPGGNSPLSDDSSDDSIVHVTSEGAAPNSAAPQAWAVQTQYGLGVVVSYNNVLYVCIQAHTSLDGWQPDRTPALWLRAPSEGTTPVPPIIPSPGTGPQVDLSPYRQRALEMPFKIDLPSVLKETSTPPTDGEQPETPPSSEEQAKKLLDEHTRLSSAVNELLALEKQDMQVSEKNESSKIDVPEGQNGLALKADQLSFYKKLAATNLDMLKPANVDGDTPRALEIGSSAGTAPAVTLAQTLLSQPSGIAPLAGFNPNLLPQGGLKVKESVSLSGNTASTLKEAGIVIGSTPLPKIISTLRQHIDRRVESLQALAPPLERTSITRVGSALVQVKTPIESRVTDLIFGKLPNFGGKLGKFLPILPPDGRIPHTRGKIASVGVADLLVVKQQLKGYEAVDIAHIENVLKGESKGREHTDVRRTESTTFTEEESTNAEEHELGSTQRFEMSKETSNTLKEDASIKAGLRATAKYGMVLEVSANVEGSLSRSREEVNKTASKYSQDVTQRTVKKITDRVLQRQSFTTGTEVTKKNSHGLDNKSGTTNVSGVYQWVNKVYEAQVFNYGLRTMFDFMVPEPAAFLMAAMTQSAHGASADIVKPTPLLITAKSITRANYTTLALRYGATDVTSPPEDYVTRTDQASRPKGDNNTEHIHSAVIQIPQGYEAVHAGVSAVWNQYSTDASIDVFVGTDVNRIKDDGSWVWSTTLENQEAELAWGFQTFRISSVAVGLQVTCKATPRAFEAWQVDTHGKLYNAWKARDMEYQEKLERVKLQQGIVIEGRNPTANLDTVKQELKKNCIEIMTGQHFDLFNSIQTGSNGLPQINLSEAEAEGEYVRFFEQAFEWDQLSYVTYPYFWGSKSRWPDRLAFDDPDPTFDEFLKAGFARVVVPARPGFEGAIEHFQRFGQLWKGGPMPAISDSELYLAIADEIAERAKRPGAEGEVPQGDPWEVRVPTTLVKLRADDRLPAWRKREADGVWVAVAEGE